jgi:hypothetical protein
MFATGQITVKYFAHVDGADHPGRDRVPRPGGDDVGRADPLRGADGVRGRVHPQFLIGGLSGIFTGSPPLDYHVTDSYFIVGHFHYTLFAGSLFVLRGLLLLVAEGDRDLPAHRHRLDPLRAALRRRERDLLPDVLPRLRRMPRRVADYDPQFTDLNRSRPSARSSSPRILAWWSTSSSLVRRERRPPTHGRPPLEWATARRRRGTTSQAVAADPQLRAAGEGVGYPPPEAKTGKAEA